MPAMIDPTHPKHTVHKRVVEAFQEHWKAHGDKYPQRFRLPPEELWHLDNIMHKGEHPGIMWGVPLEADPATKGEMVAIDGTVVPIAPPEPGATP
jgi:hypothetical protein